MKQSSKYSLNGVYTCENLTDYVEDNDFPEIPIGSALGLDGWYIEFSISYDDDGTWLFPFISHNNHPEIQVRAYFNVLKKDGSSLFETITEHGRLEADEGVTGNFMELERMLNGYLYHGSLTVEYGLQVESEQMESGIWRFNFFDKFFDWKNQNNMFQFTKRDENSLFGHKQIVQLHSKKVSNSNKDWVRVPKSITDEELVMCLQVTHGVRLQMTVEELKLMTKIAFHFGFSNTVRYCEGQLIKLDEKTKVNIRNFRVAVKYDLRCYLVHLLKHIKSKRQLIKILRRLDVEKMSSESIKAIVAKFFNLIRY